ncbi:MAG: hypothetical protein J6C08_00110 [Campylobacter sp.]|uniref:hypothetical protein n=1 Tax=Campylobacter sp. TaxID=205 RepID=UPI001AFEF58B|nr:hypothetical protein [Campylobacter sp.]MBO5062903.1 hypothetical protein [Campylobacter sp.]
MATISKGIKLFLGEKELTNLQEIPELNGDTEAIEVTTLADEAHVYTDGIKNYGDSLAFKFLYEKAQFIELNGQKGAGEWKVELSDGTTCTFSGTCSVKLDGVGVNAALTYTLSIKPNSAMIWA